MAIVHPIGPLQMASAKSDPAFTIFLPFICPWIPAILATSVLPDLAQATRELRQVGLILAITLSVVAVGFVAIPDLRRSPVQPFMLRSVDAAAQIDARLRKPLRDDYQNARTGSAGGHCY